LNQKLGLGWYPLIIVDELIGRSNSVLALLALLFSPIVFVIYRYEIVGDGLILDMDLR
jgi:hypothetical protein